MAGVRGVPLVRISTGDDERLVDREAVMGRYVVYYSRPTRTCVCAMRVFLRFVIAAIVVDVVMNAHEMINIKTSDIRVFTLSRLLCVYTLESVVDWVDVCAHVDACACLRVYVCV